MFRFLPDDPAHLKMPRPPDEMRRRALELVLLELKHQPVLKAQCFGAGFVAGLVTAGGIALGIAALSA